MEHAVHTKTDPQVALLRFDVDVRCSVGDRLLDDVVDELDGGRFTFDAGEVVEFLVSDVLRAHEGVLVTMLGDGIELLDCRDDVVLRGDGRLDVVAGQDPKVVKREYVLRVGHRHQQHAVLGLDRHQRVARGHVTSHQRNRVRLRSALGEVDVLDTDLLGHDRENRALCRVSHVDEHPADGAAGRTMHLKGIVELGLGYDPGTHEELPESLSCLCHLATSPQLEHEGTHLSQATGARVSASVVAACSVTPLTLWLSDAPAHAFKVAEQNVGILAELRVGLGSDLDADPIVPKPHLNRSGHDKVLAGRQLRQDRLGGSVHHREAAVLQQRPQGSHARERVAGR